MKKLLSLLMLLVAIVTGAKAEDFTVTPITGSYNYTSLAKVTINSPSGSTLKISSGQIQTSSKNDVGYFTISTTQSGLYIKSISFTDANHGNANKLVTLEKTSDGGSLSHNTTDDVWNYSGGTTNSVSFQMTAGSGGAGKLGTISIVVSSETNNIETLSGFSLSSGTYSFTTNVAGETAVPTVALTTPTSSGGGVNGSNISLNNGRTITFTSERNIKYIAFNDANCRAIFTVDAGGGSCDGATWSAGETATKSVTLKNNAGTTLGGLNKVYVITEPEGPVDPEFSLSAEEVEVGSTISVNGPAGLLFNAEPVSGTTGAVSVSGSTITGVTAGAAQVRVTSAATSEYNAYDHTFDITVKVPAVKYSVEYKLNGGSGDAPTQESLAEGSVFTVASAEGITAPDGKVFSTWNDGTNDYAPGADYTIGTSDVILTAQWVDIYTNTPDPGMEHGSVSTDKITAVAGETVTLTATPQFRYKFKAWNVYKTGEPTTTITVTDNKFTMPAYNVTYGAIFEADTRKQVLYVTSDGNADDDLYSALSEDYTVTVAANNATKTVTDFDLVVLHESIGGTSGTSGLAAAAKAGDVPVLNTKSYFYNSGRWGWGTPNAGKEELGCTIGTAYFNIASHPIFAGITPDADGFITVTTAASSDHKVMQPVGSFVSGKEGYTLATSSNADSGNGTAIHELTPAQRGVEAGKYLLISVHNQCLNKLTDDGKKLFKNAAEYLMSDEAWTPEENKSLPLNDGGSSFTKGFTTFCSPVNFTVSEGATAYKAAIADSKLTMTALEGIIPANEGVVIAGNKNGNATITATTAAATANVEGNDLKGTTAEALTADLKGTAAKFLAFKKSNSTFTPYGGTNFPANKAYLLLDSNNDSQSLEMVFDEATGINVVNAAETEAQAAPVKVIKNGKLFIGNYNVAGQQVK